MKKFAFVFLALIMTATLAQAGWGRRCPCQPCQPCAPSCPQTKCYPATASGVIVWKQQIQGGTIIWTQPASSCPNGKCPLKK